MILFVNFVNEIKKGYSKDSLYHSHYHTFDVMYVCYLLINKCKVDKLLDGFNIYLSLLVILVVILAMMGLTIHFIQQLRVN